MIFPNEQISKTIYSVPWPKTENIIKDCFQRDTEIMFSRHRKAYTKKQDEMSYSFFNAWKKFVSPTINGLDSFKETYPTAGSSEGIREIIHTLDKNAPLIIFDGDYEGYEAYANASNKNVIRINRDRWKKVLSNWIDHGVPWSNDVKAQWWISQPSSINGNEWNEFDAWLKEIEKLKDHVEIWLDLCYVGASEIKKIDVSTNPITGVVFSLSKVFGVYYRRIGGVLSKRKIDGLWGNRWFKNLDSMYFGEKLMLNNDCTKQSKYIKDLNKNILVPNILNDKRWKECYIQWIKSDVPLIITANINEKSLNKLNNTNYDDLKEIVNLSKRGTSEYSYRLCISPTIENCLLNQQKV